MGWTFSGGLAWKFSYSKKVIDGLESNSEFIEGMNSWVFKNYGIVE